MIAIWVTDKGEQLPVGIMSDSHLRNCIWAIQKGEIDRRPFCNGFHNNEWVEIFQAELIRRTKFEIKN